MAKELKAEGEAPAQKAVFAKKSISKAQALANRMKAVEEAGNMTPKMQRGFDRMAAKINKK